MLGYCLFVIARVMVGVDCCPKLRPNPEIIRGQFTLNFSGLLELFCNVDLFLLPHTGIPCWLFLLSTTLPGGAKRSFHSWYRTICNPRCCRMSCACSSLGCTSCGCSNCVTWI